MRWVLKHTFVCFLSPPHTLRQGPGWLVCSAALGLVSHSVTNLIFFAFDFSACPQSDQNPNTMPCSGSIGSGVDEERS